MKKTPPSMDAWLKEAKADPTAEKIGMYLVHNGTVRRSPKAQVREGVQNLGQVEGMYFAYDEEKVDLITTRSPASTSVFMAMFRPWVQLPVNTTCSG